MSYSFSVRAATKAEAKAKVAEQLAGVLKSQPTHAVDVTAAQAGADTFIDLVSDNDTKDLMVTVNGSVGWVHQSDPLVCTQAGFGVNAYLVDKLAS
ncbi:hypothetical protein ACSFBX_34790 [Variovorax sp. RB2P76]|uniref:hypothetical protein n=1 Tax=Variovorax sp. RB2P76 TaxID=3443736 RepID=UPI003F44DE64